MKFNSRDWTNLTRRRIQLATTKNAKSRPATVTERASESLFIARRHARRVHQPHNSEHEQHHDCHSTGMDSASSYQSISINRAAVLRYSNLENVSSPHTHDDMPPQPDQNVRTQALRRWTWAFSRIPPGQRKLPEIHLSRCKTQPEINAWE